MKKHEATGKNTAAAGTKRHDAEAVKFFQAVPGFLEMMRNIGENGFFSDISSAVDGCEGALSSIAIRGTGLVPTKPEDNTGGVRSLIDIDDLLTRLIELVKDKVFVIDKVTCGINTTDWNREGREGQTTGRKGTSTRFEFVIFLNTNAQFRAMALAKRTAKKAAKPK